MNSKRDSRRIKTSVTIREKLVVEYVSAVSIKEEEHISNAWKIKIKKVYQNII